VVGKGKGTGGGWGRKTGNTCKEPGALSGPKAGNKEQGMRNRG